MNRKLDTSVSHQFPQPDTAEQSFQELRLKAGLHPPEIMFRAKNDWHSVVAGGDHLVGFRGEAWPLDSSPAILQKATAFFESNSTLSKEISHILFLLREADAKEVHSDITMIALCALFENLIQLLFRELKLEEQAKNEDGTFKDVALQSFIQARETTKVQITHQISASKNAAEGEGWKRIQGVIGTAAPFTTSKKFQSILDQLQFDPQWRSDMELAFKTWYDARQHLFHYKERTSESEDDKKKAILDQCRIAGAINVLLLKLVGYSGLMRVSTFEGIYR